MSTVSILRRKAASALLKALALSDRTVRASRQARPARAGLHLRFMWACCLSLAMVIAGVAHEPLTVAPATVPGPVAGVITTIADPPGSTEGTVARGINNLGQIVGYFYGDTVHGFLLSAGAFTTIDVPGYTTYPSGINDAGQIVGYIRRRTSTLEEKGFLLDGSTLRIIDFPGAARTHAYGINNAGQIVGAFWPNPGPDPEVHGYLLSGSTFIRIDGPNGEDAFVSGINNDVTIVGQYFDLTEGRSRGFLSGAVGITPFDVPGPQVHTFPWAINDVGQIAGEFALPGTPRRGFLSSQDSLDLVLGLIGQFAAFDHPETLVGTNARGINNAGQIVGDFYPGYPQSFVAEFCRQTATRPTSVTVAAQQPTATPSPLENFDHRDRTRAAPQRPTEAATGALERLKSRAGATILTTWNPLNGTPRSLVSASGYLTAPSPETPTAIALTFLETQSDLFGLTNANLASFKVARDYRTEHNGLTHLTLRQYDGGIPVFEGELRFTIDQAGRIVTMGGDYFPGISIPTTPGLSPAEALKAAAGDVAPGTTFEPEIRSRPAGPIQDTLFDKGPFNRTDAFHQASLVIFPTQAEFRLAWQVIFHKNSRERYLILVDARTGEILYRVNLVKFQTRGLVFEEHPDSGPQVLKSFDGDPLGSPMGWLFQNGGVYSTLGGNNTCTQEDRDGDDDVDVDNNGRVISRVGDGGYSPTAASGQFEYPFLNAYENSGGTDVDTDVDAALTNLFHWVNLVHDYYYRLGFDEVAGNFQWDNFSNLGLGRDEVYADAQDAWTAGERNNANFYTPPDGFDRAFGKPRMQMYLWTSPPLRNADVDFDGDVLIHEYTHGLSNRLVGGPGDAAALEGIQSGAMGEGWGDWFAASIFNDPVVGEYVIGYPSTGLRRYALDANPLTYGDICTGGVPGGPKTECEVHDDGEIWSAVLWDLRQAFIYRYGYEAGKQRVERLVVDGMKASMARPSMLDMRNAILAADGQGNQDLIWLAFCRRGMGFSAGTVDDDDPYPVEAFDLQDGSTCGIFNTLAVSVTGQGTVTSDPSGISCPPTCSAVFPRGTTVAVAATAASGWAFESWGGECAGQGNPCSVTMWAPKSATTTFIAHTLQITSGPTGTPNPVASAGMASLSVTAVDSLGHAPSYQWSATCPARRPSGSFSDATAQNPTWTAPANITPSQQDCTIRVTVSDGAGLSATGSYAHGVSPARRQRRRTGLLTNLTRLASLW